MNFTASQSHIRTAKKLIFGFAAETNVGGLIHLRFFLFLLLSLPAVSLTHPYGQVKQMSERSEQTSTWTSEWLSTSSRFLVVPNKSALATTKPTRKLNSRHLLSGTIHYCHRTMVWNKRESRRKFWATRLSVRSFARTAHFAHSLARGKVNF